MSRGLKYVEPLRRYYTRKGFCWFYGMDSLPWLVCQLVDSGY